MVRADVGLPASVDTANTKPTVVQIFSQRNSDGGVFFNCTGSIINPRTILTATLCVESCSFEVYGLPSNGAGRTMQISTGVDSSVLFFNCLNNGAGYADGGVTSIADVMVHPSSILGNRGLRLPWAYVALITDNSSILDAPSMPLLLTPLTELIHVVQVGANLRASISVTSDMGRGVLSNYQAQASLSWRF